MAYYGEIICSKCFEKYTGVDCTYNLCNKCSKEKEEKRLRLVNKVLTEFSKSKSRFGLLFDFIFKKYEDELIGYLIKELDIEVEKEEIRFK